MERKFDILLEELSRLYLRLNGFVVQNLIIHSEQQGQSCGELDIIAVRFPLHSQLDTGNRTSDFIEASKDRIQIIVGDCKNYKKKEKLEFSPIRKNKDSIVKLIKWLGISEKS